MTETFLADEPLSLPASPTEPAPTAFPLIASLAPLVAAGVIWLVTGSAFVLLFAVLGPVIAVASVVDGRRAARRRRRRDAAAHDVALAELRTAVVERHSELRRRRRQETPSASVLLKTPDLASRWRPRSGGGVPVVLGSGNTASGIRLEGAGAHRELRTWAATLADAPITADASGGLALVGPAVLVGAFARALLVQLAFVLAPDRFALEPVASDHPADDDWAWTRALPHSSPASRAVPPVSSQPVDSAGHGEPVGKVVLLRFTDTSIAGHRAPAAVPPPRHPRAPWLLLAEDLIDVPPGCATVVRVCSATRAEVLFSAESEGTGSPVRPVSDGSRPGPSNHREFRPELVTREEAGGFARLLRDRAGAAGLLGRHRSLPDRVTRAELDALAGHPLAAASAVTDREGLACAIGVGANGPVILDLVGQGPHAVVGGTTGSGKSELLVSWVSQMAAGRSPDEVAFLLIDFKGGAAFRPLAVLPHCVGLVTDLDGRQAERALASLAAELRHREHVLAAAGARDLAELRAFGGTGSPGMSPGKVALPRLVIVVDEFATMLASFPELHSLFVDIAARGRSLGVHLVLCTQRPAGVVRDALLANCTLRISLRVNNAADSQAVLGTDAAAAISAAVPGRCFIALGDGDPQPCQVATTSGEEIEVLAAAADTARAGRVVPPRHPRRPWLDPLPDRVTPADLDALEHFGRPDSDGKKASTRNGTRGFPFGLVDEPDRQRYSVARFGAGDGSLFVLGGARSGKTSALAIFASQARAAHEQVSWPNPDVETVWDALTEARTWIDRGGADRGRLSRSTRLLLLDDFDSICARWEPDHRQAALECLASLLRDGLSLGLHVLIAAQRLNGPLQNLAALCQDHLLLRLPDRAEHLASGGLAAQYDPTLPPGGGHWRDRRIQVLAPETAVPVDASPVSGAADDALPGPDSRSIATVLSLKAGTSIILVSGSPTRAAAHLRADAAHPHIVELTAGAGAAHSAAPVPSAAPAPANTDPVLAGLGPATVFIGDAETWQANWSLLAALRVRAPLVFDGCTLADYRMLTRRRDLPPPLAPGRGHLWSLSPDGDLTRVVFGPA